MPQRKTVETTPSYGLLVINHAYNEGKIILKSIRRCVNRQQVLNNLRRLNRFLTHEIRKSSQLYIGRTLVKFCGINFTYTPLRPSRQ